MTPGWKRLHDAEREISNIPLATLGSRFREYVAESNHQGWDGFSPRELTTIRKLLEDFVLFSTAYDLDEKKGG